MAQVPNFINGVGRIATDRYDFEEHIDGYSFRHQANQIDLNPPVTITGTQTNVQGAIAALSLLISPPVVPDATTSTKGILQLTGDISGTSTDVITVGLQGKPILNIVPGLNDLLTWNGSAWTPTPLSAGTIAYGGTVPWADSTSNPATTINGQLTKIVTDLAATTGDVKIGSPARSSGLISLSAGSIGTQLSSLISSFTTDFIQGTAYSPFAGAPFPITTDTNTVQLQEIVDAINPTVQTITTDYSIQPTDTYIYINISAGINLNLPNPGSCIGKQFIIIDMAETVNSDNGITLNPFSSEQINNNVGGSPIFIRENGLQLIITTDGINWTVIKNIQEIGNVTLGTVAFTSLTSDFNTTSTSFTDVTGLSITLLNVQAGDRLVIDAFLYTFTTVVNAASATARIAFVEGVASPTFAGINGYINPVPSGGSTSNFGTPVTLMGAYTVQNTGSVTIKVQVGTVSGTVTISGKSSTTLQQSNLRVIQFRK